MTTPPSDERLTARTIAQFRHWVALSDSTEDADERRRLDAMLAASVPDLLDEVERLRAENAGLQHLADCQAGYVDGTATVNERLRQCRADRKALRARVAELVAVLREVEWVREDLMYEYPERWCPRCQGVEPAHHSDCALDAALNSDAAISDAAVTTTP